ncbi:MAG: hypothetical protein IK990_08080 [Ruminiclostridium sp.]|nr:hypothetical protein [Ruminiclostridium sp.]
MVTILRDTEIADKLVFNMEEDGRRVGGITAKLTNDGDLLITALDSELELYYDGLCRTVLAYANMRGVDRAVFDITDERQLYRLRGFGFIPKDGKVLDSITDFFSKECS